MQKTWLITGVSSGLGRILAQKALARGDSVIGTSRKADALPDLRERYPQRLHIIALDLRDQGSVRAAVDRAFDLGLFISGTTLLALFVYAVWYWNRRWEAAVERYRTLPWWRFGDRSG